MATEFKGSRTGYPRLRAGLGAFAAPTAPDGAPNVLYLVWDDTGIATWDCFGGLVDMPNMSRIAERGVRLSQFHTTALCSPTRASLLTGRNATTVGMATIEEFTDGFPNCNGRIPSETALISEVLAEQGCNTYCVGKWHLTPLEESNLAATKRHWPLSRGFERFYGFMGGETDQWYPDLVYDNHPVAPPATPEEGYHLSKDIADKTIEFIRDAKVIAPDKPWFSYVCPGAGHAPHHVFAEWANRYAGRFDMGYERYREVVLENQKRLGIVPPDTELSPVNPYLGCQGAQRRTVAVAGHGAAVGIVERRGEAAVLPDGRGVRRVPVLHRRPDRPHPGLPRGVRPARQHDHRGDLRQRRIRRGWSERLGQRGEVLQRLHRHRRGEHAVLRPARRPADLQPLPDRVGDGVQHALQAVQALRLSRGRHRRHRNHLLAQRNRGARRGP